MREEKLSKSVAISLEYIMEGFLKRHGLASSCCSEAKNRPSELKNWDATEVANGVVREESNSFGTSTARTRDGGAERKGHIRVCKQTICLAPCQQRLQAGHLEGGYFNQVLSFTSCTACMAIP